MFCPKCGSQQPDNAKFCGVCGYRFNTAQTNPPSQAGGIPGAAPGAQPYAGQPVASAIPVPNAIKQYGAIIAIALAAIVLAITILAPTVDSPLYSTLRSEASRQGADVSSTPGAVELGLIDFAGLASGLNSVSNLASITGGSDSTVTDTLGDISGTLGIVKIILIAWILVAVLIGISISTYKSNPAKLGKVLLITLAVEFILCVIWFFVVGAASNALTDAIGGKEVIDNMAELANLKGNTSMLGVSLWGWLATILSLVGGAAAFLNSRS